MTEPATRMPRIARTRKRRSIHSERENFKNQLGEILSYVEQLEFPFESAASVEPEPVEVHGTVLGDGSSFRRDHNSAPLG